MSEPTTELQIFDPIQAEIASFSAPTMSLLVSTPATFTGALEVAKQIKSLEKAVEEKRKFLVDPLNARVKIVNAYAKKLMEPLERAERHLKNQMIAWETKLAADRAAEARRLEEERRKKEAELEAKRKEEERKVSLSAAFGTAPPAVSAVAQETLAHEKTMALAEKQNEDNRVKGTQKVWNFRVTDETLVPREFLLLNAPAIRFAIRNGVRQIEGVEIFEETRMSIR